MSLESETLKIMEYNLATVFGGALKLYRDGGLLATGTGSLVRSGVQIDVAESGEGSTVAARAVLPRPTFPLPQIGDVIEDVANGEKYRVRSLGRFGGESAEAICELWNPRYTGGLER